MCVECISGMCKVCQQCDEYWAKFVECVKYLSSACQGCRTCQVRVHCVKSESIVLSVCRVGVEFVSSVCLVCFGCV